MLTPYALLNHLGSLGQFRFPAVQRYIHDLSSEMGEHIDNITSALSMFIEVGKTSQ